MTFCRTINSFLELYKPFFLRWAYFIFSIFILFPSDVIFMVPSLSLRYIWEFRFVSLFRVSFVGWP